LAEERRAEEAMGDLGWTGRNDEKGDGVWWIKQTVSSGNLMLSLACGIWYRIRYTIYDIRSRAGGQLRFADYPVSSSSRFTDS